jgi:dTDP-4-dehydrorhamnose reductase
VVNDQVGSPTYAADLAEAIMKIIASGKWIPGIYQFSNEGIISWYEFALAINELIGSSCKISPIPTTSYPTPARRPAWSVLDKSKLVTTYGISTKDWKSSLKRCLECFK